MQIYKPTIILNLLADWRGGRMRRMLQNSDRVTFLLHAIANILHIIIIIIIIIIFLGERAAGA
jgi:hypothetical protein